MIEIEKPRTIISLDVDGVLLHTTTEEQIFNALAGQLADYIEVFFQKNPSMFREWRDEKSDSFLRTRTINEEAIAALQHLHEEVEALGRNGIEVDIAILTNRPQRTHALSVQQLQQGCKDIEKIIDNDKWWENPAGNNPKRFKADVAQRFKEGGVSHVHIEDNRQTAIELARIGTEVYLTKSVSTTVWPIRHHNNLTLVCSTMEAVDLFLEALQQ